MSLRIKKLQILQLLPMSFKNTFYKKTVNILFIILSATVLNAQTSLPYFTDFETNNGGWIDGGNRSDYVASTYSPQGNRSWLLRDSGDDNSSFYQYFDLMDYSLVTISFSFQSVYIDDSEDLFTLWLDQNAILTYKYTIDWNSNNSIYTVTVILDSEDFTFTNNNKIRFETSGGMSRNDYIFFDEISITGEHDAIWRNDTWTNGVHPNINRKTIIDDNYNTATNGSFSSYKLTINSGFNLVIDDTNFVEVENNLTVNGNIVVQPKGAFVQNNDNSEVNGAVLSDKTKIVVNKETAYSNAWYEYTYWSSPVINETIGNGLFESSTSRRFMFNAQNYLDHCAESSNDNTCIPGLQDGIDDDGNDWQWVSGTTVMQPGVGYASTHNSSIFNSTPGCPGLNCNIKYSFNGPFNNGVVKVPVYRNDSELNDTNSNFIGNPYPSAIDVDAFFDLNAYNASSNPNGTLEGTIYLWSQNTAPSSTANGNQNLNFSDLDYAIINGVDGIAGGDGIIPNRFIPSGQAFFVNYSNYGATVAVNGDIKTGEVIFNNSMRIADGTSNSQFFRTSSGPLKTKKAFNKIWVNLTSDNGVFSQVLVGYIDGATNSFDGAYFDAPRNLSPKTASALYSTISENQSKYAIQGKDPNSLNLDEVIPLGFYTAITGATLYKLSIAQIEGDFLTSNTMYLKDNLLNKVHNITESDYSFTSEVGEFKDRFEIVFQSESLSDIEAQLNINKLTIIELNDGRVQIKSNSNHTIDNVEILDLLGRTLYQLKGTSTTEIYNLNTLSQSTYIAKVELSNGQIIIKKAIKRN